MPLWMQTILVILIVAAAAGWLLRGFVAQARGKGGACGGCAACGGCGGRKRPEDN